jgi:hypothetical protein
MKGINEICKVPPSAPCTNLAVSIVTISAMITVVRVGIFIFETSDLGTKITSWKHHFRFSFLITHPSSSSLAVENENHCDFVKLREMLIRVNMEDLREQTHTRHYELYRRCKLEEMGFKDTDPDSKPFRYQGTQQPGVFQTVAGVVHRRNNCCIEALVMELMTQIIRHCHNHFVCIIATK